MGLGLWDEQAAAARHRFERTLASHGAYLNALAAAADKLERTDSKLAELVLLAHRLKAEAGINAASQRRTSLEYSGSVNDANGFTAKADRAKSPPISPATPTFSPDNGETFDVKIDVETLDAVQVHAARTCPDPLVEVKRSSVTLSPLSVDPISPAFSQASEVSPRTPNRRVVSWADQESQRLDFRRCSVVEAFPAHGHWLPEELVTKRMSFQSPSARRLGGRVVKLDTKTDGLGVVECILIEPMGVFLAPQEYVSTGFVVCLTGQQPTEQALEEWGQLLKRTKLLDAGISVAFIDIGTPDGVEPDVADVEAAVAAAVRAAHHHDCFILCGKAWAAKYACELASLSCTTCYTPAPDEEPAEPVLRISNGSVAGIVLLAPQAPPPPSVEYIEVPVLVIWAKDDKESPYEEGAEIWADALEGRTRSSSSAPSTAWRECAIGGHDFGRVLRKDERAAHDFMHFTAACLLKDGLSRAAADFDFDTESLPEWLPRLCDELPSILASRIDSDLEDPDDVMALSEALTGLVASRGVATAALRLERVLQDWLALGMPEAFPNTARRRASFTASE